VLEVCRIYGWTYHEYMAQPNWFTELAIERMAIDNQRRKKAQDALQ